MLHLEAEWTSKQNIWQNLARSPILRFGGENTFLWGKISIFIIYFKQIFLSATKFGGNKKIWG